MNGREFVTAALREIRVVGPGFDLDAEDADDTLGVLNRMINTWSGMDLMIPYRTREELTLTGGDYDYTIGVGGNFNTTRPLRIEAAKLRLSGTDYDLTVTHDARRFELESDSTTQGRPELLYYNPVAPLGLIYFANVPDQAYTLILTSLKPITSFATLDTEDAVPDEYEEAIVSNLAVRAAPLFGKEAAQTTKTIAERTLNALTMRNQSFRVPSMSMPTGIRRRAAYNITSDE